MNAQAICALLEATFNLPRDSMAPDTRLALQLGTGMHLDLEVCDAEGELRLGARIGSPPRDTRDALLVGGLLANTVLAEYADHHLAFHPELDTLLLCQTLPTEPLTRDLLLLRLREFVTRANAYQRRFIDEQAVCA
ncbi:type III secretion system chaperone [Ramlibacter sp. AN1015]|uniref:type III secretion system chaperone n=1 Tax=Ramlibacter sp. AN1015 TaxID=3133428 RepID=UPI0030C5F3F3